MRSLFALLGITILGLFVVKKDHEVIGTVHVKGSSLPLVGVKVESLSYGDSCFTDYEGNFSVRVNSRKDSIRFTLPHYKTKTVSIKDLTKVHETIALEESEALDEIVIIGNQRLQMQQGLGSEDELEHIEPIASTIDELSAVVKHPAPPISEATGKPAVTATQNSKGTAKINELAPSPSIHTGQLTVGEINDFNKWKLWDELSNEEILKYRNIWKMQASERYTAQVIGTEGYPVVDADVSLISLAGKTLWKAKTDNQGRAELWSNYFVGEEQTAAFAIQVNVEGQVKKLTSPKEFHDGINFIHLNQSCKPHQRMDVAFVVDATGSMGDEIDYLKSEMLNVVRRVEDSLPGTKVRLSSVFYKDSTDDFLVKMVDLSDHTEKVVEFLQKQFAGGGGDYPEAVDAALEAAVNQLNWSPKADARIMFLLLDAPPRTNSQVHENLKTSIKKAARKGIRIVPVTASGINKSTEFLMRNMALATNGTYTFLTDNRTANQEYTSQEKNAYSVEYLNELLLRLLVRYSKVPSCTNHDLPEFNITDTIHRKEKYIRWSLFPKATRGRLSFKPSRRLQDCQVVDINGKLLLRPISEVNTRGNFSMGQFPNGTYQIRFQYKDAWHTETFTVAR